MTTKIRALDYLTPEQIAIIRQSSDWRGVWVALHAWAVIFGAMALFVWFPNPITFIIAFIIIGGRQLGLAILMHDASHGVLCKSPKLNEFVGQWLGAYPIMADCGPYRRYHLKHHANTQQENDPDLILSAPFPITRKSFRRKVIRDLTGQTGYRQRLAQIINAWGPKELSFPQHCRHFWDRLGRPLITHLILLAGLTAVGHWYLYFVLWLAPFLTWQQLITRVRNIAEHAMVPDNNDVFRSSRTTELNLFERAIAGPYWVNYHVEHHLMMWVPCYHLPKARRFLIENGHGDRMESKKGFLSVLRMATSKPDNQDGPGEIVHNTRRRVAGVVSEGFEAAS